MPNLVISLAHTGRLAKAFAGRRHRGKLCSVNLWMALAVPNDVCRWHQAGLPSSHDHVRLARRNGNHLDVPSMSADDTLLSWAGSNSCNAAVVWRGVMCYPWGRKHRGGRELRFRTV